MTKPGSRRIIALVASAALTLFVAPAVALAAPPGAIDSDPCIASDALGYRYIAFGRAGVAEPGIYLATNRSGTWRVGAHPVAIGERCAAIAIDGGRHVHLLSVHLIPDDPNELDELLYATNRSGSWRSSFVHYGEHGVVSMAFDRGGHPNIAASDEDGAFLTERTDNGEWVIRYDVGGRTSHLRVDPDGYLWVVMTDVGNLRFLRLTDRSGGWVASRIPLPYDQQVELDLAIDGSGRRYMSIYHPSSGAVTIRRNLGATWPIVDRTREPSRRLLMEMEIEPSGAIHLMFRSSATKKVLVDLNHHGGTWKTQLVGYWSGSWSDIEVDRRGRVSAAYSRDGVVWSYWNPWTKPPNRFAISSL